MKGSVLSGWSAAWVQAAWTIRRLRRGRMLWVAGFFALGPIAFALLVVQSGRTVKWDDLFAPLLLLTGIVPPLLTAATTADEIEDRTFTYLWSRPLPRWSVLVGKLLAAIPLSMAILCLTTVICYQLAQRGVSPVDPWPALALPRALGAVSLAALSLSLVSGGIAILMPRHGLAVAYAYLLVLDLPLSAMPFSIAKLSVTHHILILGGASPSEATGSPGASAIWLLTIGALWLALGLWRLSRSEFSSDAK